MDILNLSELLSGNDYPGRGIIIGRSFDGENAVIAYFIMGRSENSRNRIFDVTDDGIQTKAFDESKLTDPSLIIYHPVRTIENLTVVTNGDQTDTVCEYLKRGLTFEEALRTRTFEPDPPNYTPRVSGIVSIKDGMLFYKLSILKSADGNSDSTRRYFYEYSYPVMGVGHFIHTYKSNGNPIPSFDGEPEPVEIKGDIDEFTDTVWNSLNEDNKVSLFTRFININTMETQTRIVNKNK
jgi:IMP cyclohydrolase